MICEVDHIYTTWKYGFVHIVFIHSQNILSLHVHNTTHIQTKFFLNIIFNKKINTYTNCILFNPITTEFL